MTMYRCHRDRFTAEQYDSHSHHFAPIPANWLDGSGLVSIADVWKHGGSGAIALLPILARIAASGIDRPTPYSREELSRLLGIDQKTLDLGRKALVRLGVCSTSVARRRAVHLMHWTVNPGLIKRAKNGRLDSNYFSFSLRTIHGGQWSRCTGAQKAIYLVLGLLGRTHLLDGPVYHELLAALGRRDLPPDILVAGAGKNVNNETNKVRLVLDMSLRELARYSGVDLRTVSRAINDWKPKHVWHHRASRCRETLIEDGFLPVWVYPSGTGALVYHLRDHAKPYPLPVINRERDWLAEDARGMAHDPCAGHRDCFYGFDDISRDNDRCPHDCFFLWTSAARDNACDEWEDKQRQRARDEALLKQNDGSLPDGSEAVHSGYYDDSEPIPF